MAMRMRQRSGTRRPARDLLGRSESDRAYFERGWADFQMAPVAGLGTKDPTQGTVSSYRNRSPQLFALGSSVCLFLGTQVGIQDYQLSRWHTVISHDKGRSWQAPVLLYVLSDYVSGSKWIGGQSIGLSAAGTVHMVFGKLTGTAGTASDMTVWYRSTSYAANPTLDVAGWAAETDISAQVNPNDYPFFIVTGRMAEFQGAMVAVGYYRKSGNPTAFPTLIYSTDGGTTWTPKSWNEAQALNQDIVEPVCEVIGQRLYINARYVNHSGRRQCVVEDITGAMPDFTNMTDGSANIAGYNCMGGVCADGNDMLVVAPVNNGTDLRGYLRVWRSTDAATSSDPTFPAANGMRTLSHGWNGYVSLIRVGRGEYLAVAERDIDREWTASSGVPAQYLWAWRFSKKWLQKSLADEPEIVDLQFTEQTSGALKLVGTEVYDYGTHDNRASAKTAAGVSWGAGKLDFAGTGLGVSVQPLQWAATEAVGGAWDWRGDADITLWVEAALHADMAAAPDTYCGLLDGSNGGATTGYSLIGYGGTIYLLFGLPAHSKFYQVTAASVADGATRKYCIQRDRAADTVTVWYTSGGVWTLGASGAMADGEGEIICPARIVAGSFTDGSNPLKGSISRLRLVRGQVLAPETIDAVPLSTKQALHQYTAPSVTLPASWDDCQLAIGCTHDLGWGWSTDYFGGHNKGKFPPVPGDGVGTLRCIKTDKLFRIYSSPGRANMAQRDAELGMCVEATTGPSGTAGFYQRCSDATGSQQADTATDFMQTTGNFAFLVHARFLATSGASQYLLANKPVSSGYGAVIVRLNDGTLTVAWANSAGLMFLENFGAPGAIALDTPYTIGVEGLKSTTGKVKLYLGVWDDGPPAAGDFTVLTSSSSIGTAGSGASTVGLTIGGAGDDTNTGAFWRFKGAMLFDAPLGAASEYAAWAQVAAM